MDVDFAIPGAQRHPLGDLPGAVLAGIFQQQRMGAGKGLEGNDAARVTQVAQLKPELALVGADVEHQIDVPGRQDRLHLRRRRTHRQIPVHVVAEAP